MNRILYTVSIAVMLFCITREYNAQSRIDNEPGVSVKIDTTANGRLILAHSFTVDVPPAAVWKALTTSDAWEKWAVPQAEINLDIGGYIKTSYDTAGVIGDSTTITTRIINYVPNRLITLQAEIPDSFPAFMKNDEKELFNIYILEPKGESGTLVTSYGTGYRNTEEYKQILGFFAKANQKILENLITYLEANKSK